MKTILAFLTGCFIFGLLLITASTVSANEGRFTLNSGNVRCEGVSIWKDDDFQILGRCDGLVYPYRERLDRYSLWIEPDGENEPERIDNIERGSFEGQTDSTFSRLFITAEEQSSPSQPGSITVASGTLDTLGFSTASQNRTKPDDTRRDSGTVVGITGTPTPTPSSTPGSFIPGVNLTGGGFPLLLLIILVVIIIGAVVVFRR